MGVLWGFCGLGWDGQHCLEWGRGEVGWRPQHGHLVSVSGESGFGAGSIQGGWRLILLVFSLSFQLNPQVQLNQAMSHLVGGNGAVVGLGA